MVNLLCSEDVICVWNLCSLETPGFFNQVLEGYGQTETTAAASIQLIGDQTYGT